MVMSTEIFHKSRALERAGNLVASRSLHQGVGSLNTAFSSRQGSKVSASGLPPLGFLPAFEAAGRLGSFKAAAAELALTPSAISQQIKAIEDALGVILFVRRARSIALTREGELYLQEVRRALTELGNVSRRLRRRKEARVLRISTVPLFAHEFLLPRLAGFRARFPGLELNIETTMKQVDFATEHVDAAIRLGDGEWHGLMAHAIGAVDTAPVCAPALAEQIMSLADLRAQPVLGVRGQERRWDPLLTSYSLSLMPPELLTFETCYEVLRAAEYGLGVTFGMFPITTDWVMSGRLAVPLAHRQPLTGCVYLVHRSGDGCFPFVEIAAWLKAAYEALPRLPEGRIVPRPSLRAVQRA